MLKFKPTLTLISLVVFKLSGQGGFRKRIVLPGSYGTAQLPLANLPKGIYFLKLIDEDLKTFTQKIIVE